MMFTAAVRSTATTFAAMLAAIACGIGVHRPSRACAAEPTLAKALASVKIPPDWLAGVTSDYDTRQPWKKARLHIRKLLSQGKNREAIKLTYDYLVVRKANKNDHEYPMYLYLGGEHAWAAKVYVGRLADKPEGHTHEYLSLASIYVRFGEPQKALGLLAVALERLPKPPWRIATEAQVHDRIGDVHAATGEPAKAIESYRTAMRRFPQSKQPWGRHLIHRHVAKIQAKLDLLERKSLDLSRVRDGVYRGTSQGYAKALQAAVTVRGGRIVDITLKHEEKIEQGATRIVPQQIIAMQSLSVDAVTGATITVQAIVDATYRALQSAGAK